MSGLGDLNHERSINDHLKFMWNRAVAPEK